MLATGMEVTVEELWQECQTEKMLAVATRHGMTVQQMVGDFIEAGLLGNREKDPSPAEIERATAEIRAGWTPAQEQARWIAARRHDGGVLCQGG